MPRPTTRSTHAAAPFAVLLCVLFGASRARAQEDVRSDVSRPETAPVAAVCGTGIPASETRGFIPLPHGDVFCPLIADPKELGSFVSALRGSLDPFDTDIGSVGIGDRFGIMRWSGPTPGDGVQLSLVGSVFAQFDLLTPSFDLINADYLIAIPLTVRRNQFSMRLRLYHQSSHLGDEFLLRSQDPDRENLSFESVDLLLSQEAGPLRYYAGGEFIFRRQPSTLERNLAHVGVELRQTGRILRVGRLGSIRVVAAVDTKLSQEQDWKPAWSARAGVEVGRPRDDGSPGRRWRLLYEFYRGPSPYGQFFAERASYYGIGMHFTP